MGDLLKVLFSGRFDDSHNGHWGTILQLHNLFSSVLVVILDSPGRKHTAQYIQRIFQTLQFLSHISPQSLTIITNETHFAKLTKPEWDAFDCDVYAGGNQEVNDHMTSLGVPVYEQPRSFDFSARNYGPFPNQEAKS